VTGVDRDEGSGAEIRVDLRGLHELAEAIRGELEGSVRPGAGALLGVYAEGVCFGGGWWPSVDVRQAQDRYATCLAGVEDLLNAHVRAAERMVVAAETVARAYGSADALAAASADEIDRAFTAAVRDTADRDVGVRDAGGDMAGRDGAASRDAAASWGDLR
jgi:hypothetical protein